jgi:hypothetical protein
VQYVAFDIETHLIKKVGDVTTMLTPRPVCLTWATTGAARLLDRAAGYFWLRGALKDPDITLIGANVVFDLGCYCAEYPDLLPLVFIAYGAGRIRDVQMRQALIDIAHGELKFRMLGGRLKPAKRSLAALAEYWMDVELAKDGTPRLGYGDLDGVPIEEWPEDAKTYALKDASTTLDVWLLQDQHINEVTGIWNTRHLPPLADEAHQNRAAWALHLMSVWGVRTDPAMVGQLDSKLMQEHTAATLTLVRAGIVRPDKGTKDMKALRARVESAYRAIGLPAPLTEAGAVSVSADSLEGLRLATVEAGLPVDTVLKTWEDTASNAAIRTHWLPALRVGAVWPVCCQYRSPMETGRTSSSAPNMQNPPKAGGVRECFIPRPGYVYAGADYDTLELRTLAQECLEMVGRSAMADALRAGRDLHLELAAELMGIPYAQAEALYNAGDATVIERRDLAKIANFGFPGGMVAKSFKAHCARFGVIIDLAEAERLHAAWKRAWPEMDVYFRLIKGMVGWDPEGGTIVQSMSRRVRGCVTYTAACNSRFQGRAADGAKKDSAMQAVRTASWPSSTPMVKPARPMPKSAPVR